MADTYVHVQLWQYDTDDCSRIHSGRSYQTKQNITFIFSSNLTKTHGFWHSVRITKSHRIYLCSERNMKRSGHIQSFRLCKFHNPHLAIFTLWEQYSSTVHNSLLSPLNFPKNETIVGSCKMKPLWDSTLAQTGKTRKLSNIDHYISNKTNYSTNTSRKGEKINTHKKTFNSIRFLCYIQAVCLYIYYIYFFFFFHIVPKSRIIVISPINENTELICVSVMSLCVSHVLEEWPEVASPWWRTVWAWGCSCTLGPFLTAFRQLLVY